MRVPLWEWATTDGARNSACGVSATRQKAMDALSLSLVREDSRARGLVTPVMLVDGAGFLHVYERGCPANRADFGDGVITWKKNDPD